MVCASGLLVVVVFEMQGSCLRSPSSHEPLSGMVLHGVWRGIKGVDVLYGQGNFKILLHEKNKY